MYFNQEEEGNGGLSTLQAYGRFCAEVGALV